ncbi:MAG: aldo/keto reductase [Actinomycetota bacterium]
MNTSRGDLLCRELGSSGIKVFPLGVGCWAIGGADSNLGLPMGWSTAKDEDSLRGLIRAFELGASLFDTADVYGHGHSERLLGRFLREVPRDQVVIASKVGYFAGTASSAYRPLHMRHQLEQTLENLGTDYLDIYFFHNFNFGSRDLYLTDGVEQMRSFREQGLVRAIGMRGPHRFALERLTTPKNKRDDKYVRFREAFERIKPEVLAVRYNMLSPDGPDDIFTWSAQHRIGVLINKPLGQGLLTDKYDSDYPPVFGPGDHRARKRWFTPAALAVIRDGLEPLRHRFGPRQADLVRVALRYCLQRAENAAVLVGFTTPEQVEMNFTYLGEPLTTDDLAFVRATMEPLKKTLDAGGEVFLDEATT